MVNNSYSPKCIVVQCGADGLVGDPIGGFNLTPKALAECVKNVMKWEKPILFLGGGNTCFIFVCQSIIVINQHNLSELWTLRIYLT